MGVRGRDSRLARARRVFIAGIKRSVSLADRIMMEDGYDCYYRQRSRSIKLYQGP
jgi:hypothetical protein